MKNNKSQTTWVLVSVIIITISFIILSSFILNSGDSIVSSSDDSKCRAAIAASSSNLVKAADFFKEVEFACKIDEVNLDFDSEKELYSEISLLASKCWERYGKGEYDFLENIEAEGNWCYVCASIDFSGQNKGEIYNFKNYIDWTKQNNIRLANGQEVSYYKYIGFSYSNASQENISDLKQEIDTLNNMGEVDDDLILVLENIYNSVFELTLKQIDTSERLYVVHRYTRFDKNLQDKIDDAISKSIIGAGAGVSLGIIVGVFTAGKGAAVIGGLTIQRAISLQRVISIITSTLRFSAGVTASTTVAGTGAGATFGALWNNNNVQYVDIMTQEQYYRTCGTQRTNLD